MILAGLPANTRLSPNDLVTTLPAPTTTLSPKETPGRMVTPPPNQTLSPIVIGAHIQGLIYAHQHLKDVKVSVIGN